LAHQSTIYKLRKENRTRLNKRINDLKKDFTRNEAEILLTERQLSEVTEKELRDELLHYGGYELLNNEKITPHFMNLVKVSKGGCNVGEIKKDDGTDFDSDDSRSSYIHDYFKGIYKQPDNRSKNINVEDISNFLGPINMNEVVRNAILTDQERNELDVAITVAELTKSINESNQSSAPGADGISNRFIKHFWEFFKMPMLKLSNYCIEENYLPQYFLSANIKLIPKKGDLSKIKNWRPISLLNCFYKIISRVITSRLRTYMDKMTPTCQKGYSSTRYCQEVLIQVIEGIEKCKINGIRGAVISLDIKKAFDSLSHSYLQSVYKFYNFGPNLIKWITLLSTKRRACIILDGEKTTEYFDLERGNAQGDTISPFLFNLGYQLLLFKLDLSFQIEGTQRELAARVVPGGGEDQAGQARQELGNPVHHPEVNNPDPKVSAMADDCTLLVRLERDNLNRIIVILHEFEQISGLGCNLEKTALMPVGLIQPMEDEILELGLSISNEITLLGAKIKNTGICFDQNADIIVEKLRKQINFWKRFNLSLPGRVNVTKTFLYSQINYLGCFLPFASEKINIMSLEIEKFVRGKMKLGKQRFYDKIGNGGLGLFNLKNFLSAQTCAWIKRSIKQDELWKRELRYYSYGSVFNLRKKAFNKHSNPILYNMAACFEKFIFSFSATNENFMHAWIFENPCMVLDQRNNNFLTETFFDQEFFLANKNKIRNLTMNSLVNANNTLKTKQQFETISGLTLTDIKFGRLLGLARTAIANFSGRGDLTVAIRSDTAQNFCMRIKKGSKRFRNIIEGKTVYIISSNISRFADLTDTIINVDNAVKLNSQWAFNFYNNSMRTFLFKLHNNLLGLNSRVANFVRNHPRTCTFCDVLRIREENSETTKHLFFDCEIVEQCLRGFFAWVFNDGTGFGYREFFTGFQFENVNKNKALDITINIVKKVIWDCKLRYSVPTLDILKNTFLWEIRLLYKNSKTVREIIRKSDLFLNHRDIHF